MHHITCVAATIVATTYIFCSEAFCSAVAPVISHSNAAVAFRLLQLSLPGLVLTCLYQLCGYADAANQYESVSSAFYSVLLHDMVMGVCQGRGLYVRLATITTINSLSWGRIGYC
ncbi:hypothetical protein GQ53DRAFT_450063 [Thozetella sp. PMI_491]|nr:hypothetical protein GQ53DRAFT_450063 [Thozetella sp. PMI_491]